MRPRPKKRKNRTLHDQYVCVSRTAGDPDLDYDFLEDGTPAVGKLMIRAHMVEPAFVEVEHTCESGSTEVKAYGYVSMFGRF